MTDVLGWAWDDFADVRDAFGSALVESAPQGAALAVRHRGDLVVSLWGGIAQPEQSIPWTETTPAVVFSVTKGLVSILVARLVERGALYWDDPVVRYWPEFGAAGKGETTVAQLLAHRAGLSAPRLDVSPDDIVDWTTMVQMLAAQEPLWQPGSGHTYHALTHGWLNGEVLRRITGRSVGELFAEEVARPLGLDAWIGMPEAEHARVATQVVGDSLERLVAQQAADRTPGVIDWSERAMTLGGALPHTLVGPSAGFNAAAYRGAEIPAAGGIATAVALATVWSSTVVETDGVRLLGPSIVEEATVEQSAGSPVFAVPGPWPRWGMGFQLDSEARRYTSDRAFGHDGAGGQVAFADPEHELGVAFITNRMEAIDDLRATRIVDALRAIVER